jgi:hypothetical protein
MEIVRYSRRVGFCVALAIIFAACSSTTTSPSQTPPGVPSTVASNATEATSPPSLALPTPSVLSATAKPIAIPSRSEVPSTAATSPAAAPSTAPTPTASPSGSEAQFEAQWLSLGDWAPDSQHLLVYDAGGGDVLDATGQKLWGFDARETGWLGPTTIGAAGTSEPGPALETVRQYDLSGNQTAEISTVFESVVFGRTHDVLAGTYPGNADFAEGGAFSIWNGTTVSAAQPGNAQAWSEDGSHLAIVLPPWTDQKVDMDGQVAIVDATGKRVFSLGGWYGSTLGDYKFSPDGAYITACLTRDTNEIEQGAVVDTDTGLVTMLGGACTGLTWTDEPALYAPSTGLGQKWIRWTPTDGLARVAGASSDAIVLAASNGNIAIWSPRDPAVVTVVASGVTEQRQLAGSVPSNGGYLSPYMSWRPDGQALAVVYSPSGTTDGAYALQMVFV